MDELQLKVVPLLQLNVRNALRLDTQLMSARTQGRMSQDQLGPKLSWTRRWIKSWRMLQRWKYRKSWEGELDRTGKRSTRIGRNGGGCMGWWSGSKEDHTALLSAELQYHWIQSWCLHRDQCGKSSNHFQLRKLAFHPYCSHITNFPPPFFLTQTRYCFFNPLKTWSREISICKRTFILQTEIQTQEVRLFIVFRQW